MRPPPLGLSRVPNKTGSLTPPSDDCRYCTRPFTSSKKKGNFLTAFMIMQAKMEAENQQRREIIQPLVDTENVFLKVRCSEKIISSNLCFLVLSNSIFFSPCPFFCLLCPCWLKCVFMEELESFLNQREVAELRRRELLHKHWTERVWMPLQRRVEQCVSSCTAEETKRRQSLYSHYLHHCNSKVKLHRPALECSELTSCNCCIV